MLNKEYQIAKNNSTYVLKEVTTTSLTVGDRGTISVRYPPKIQYRDRPVEILKIGGLELFTRKEDRDEVNMIRRIIEEQDNIPYSIYDMPYENIWVIFCFLDTKERRALPIYMFKKGYIPDNPGTH